MLHFQQINELKVALKNERECNKTIGFVPTMGALHAGHLALIKRAVEENDICICSIFVNPIQFNNPSDLEKYPRDLEKDYKLLESAGCHMVFVPDTKEMYPKPDLTQFDFGKLDKVLEGKFRPGHFNGVAIVVKKLFGIVEPNRAYFGEKDFQQLAIINQLVEIEKLPIKIIPCPIVREKDGLAMSSRNVRLTAEERLFAPNIYKSLLSIKQNFKIENTDELIEHSKRNLNQIQGMEVEYLEIVDSKTLLPLQNDGENKDGISVLIATFLGKVRLIDNIRIEEKH